MLPREPGVLRVGEHFAQGGAPVHAGRDALVPLAAFFEFDLISQLKLPLARQTPRFRPRERHIPNRAEMNLVREVPLTRLGDVAETILSKIAQLRWLEQHPW